VRGARHHRGHPLRPAGAPVRLDHRDRPGEDRVRRGVAHPALGMDHALAPADLAWPACLPRPPTRLRRLRRRALVPVVRHRPGGSEGSAEAGQGGPVLLTSDPAGAASGSAIPPGEPSPGPTPGEPAAGSPASDSTISENSTSDELVVDGLAADTSAVAELTVGAPAEGGPAADGPAADGPVPAWLTRLAAGAGAVVGPPHPRAPHQGGRASAGPLPV